MSILLNVAVEGGARMSSGRAFHKLGAFLENPSIPKLDSDQQHFLDEPITKDEIAKALKEMPNDKSPGLYGFSTNFYKFFWPNINEFVKDSFEYSRIYGTLSDSQRLGVISLIPKKDKDLRYIRSWRPVTLLATDYKILAKTLASRLQKVIANLVSSDQVGYIKGRYLSHNVRIIEDIVSYTSKNHIPGYLVLIDFQKAFDTVEWNFLFDALKAYKFGPNFISWIKLLYTEIRSCTLNNGYLSQNFKLSRGIRQGCPISALLFLLVAEILSRKLIANSDAKGLQINNYEYKVIQLADDTTIFVKDLESLNNAIKLFLDFEKISGLKINLEKCEIVPLGPIKLDPLILPPGLRHLRINTGTFKTLGIWFSKDPDESTRLNYDTQLDKIKTTLQIWKQRNLSWKGRVMIIKTLILPQVTHLFSMTFTPQNFLVQLDKLIFTFLWRDKPPRIKRDTIIASIEDGGLKMTDIMAFHQAQKVVCMKNLILEGEKVLNLLLTITGVQKSVLKHKLSLEYLNKFPCDPFHKQLLECWFSIKSRQPEGKNTILNEYIFLNKCVVYSNKPI